MKTSIENILRNSKTPKLNIMKNSNNLGIWMDHSSANLIDISSKNECRSIYCVKIYIKNKARGLDSKRKSYAQ